MRKRFLSLIASRFTLSIFSGALFGLSWPPFDLWLFALVMPAALFLLIRDQERQTRFLLVLFFFVSAWSIAFHWNAAHPVGATALSAVVALFAMICLKAALVTVFSSTRTRDPQSSVSFLFSIPVIWGMMGIVLWDWFMMFGPIAMPGTMAGLAISTSFLADGWVPMVGSFALTPILLAINAVWVSFYVKKRIHMAGVLTLLFVLGIPFLFGFDGNGEGYREGNGESDRELKVTAIQPGSTPEAWAAVSDSDSSKVTTLESLLVEAKTQFPDTDLFVFPETSLPIADSSTLSFHAQRWAEQIESSILAGGIESDVNGTFYNVVVGADAQGTVSFYRKNRLVPFVESVPFGEFLPFSESFRLESGGVSAYASGSKLGILSVGGNLVGTLICFESFFPSDARKLANLNAELIVVPTQDGWWQSQTARSQHAAYTRLVALSSGIPVVQASVDGISAVWNARGVLLKTSRGNSEELIHASVPLSTIETPYRRHGESPSNVVLAVLLLIYLVRLGTLALSRT